MPRCTDPMMSVTLRRSFLSSCILLVWILGKLTQQQTAEDVVGAKEGGRREGGGLGGMGHRFRSEESGGGLWQSKVAQYKVLSVPISLTESFSCVFFQGVETTPGLWSSNHRAGVSLVWTESYRKEPSQNSRRLYAQMPVARQTSLGIRHKLLHPSPSCRV